MNNEHVMNTLTNLHNLRMAHTLIVVLQMSHVQETSRARYRDEIKNIISHFYTRRRTKDVLRQYILRQNIFFILKWN